MSTHGRWYLLVKMTFLCSTDGHGIGANGLLVCISKRKAEEFSQGRSSSRPFWPFFCPIHSSWNHTGGSSRLPRMPTSQALANPQRPAPFVSLASYGQFCFVLCLLADLWGQRFSWKFNVRINYNLSQLSEKYLLLVTRWQWETICNLLSCCQKRCSF